MKMKLMEKSARKRLNRREFVLLWFLFVVITSYLFYSQRLETKIDTYFQTQDNVTKVQNELNTLKAAFANGKTDFPEKIAEKDKAVAALKENLPAWVSQQEVISILNSLSVSSGLKVQLISFESAKTEDQGQMMVDSYIKSLTATDTGTAGKPTPTPAPAAQNQKSATAKEGSGVILTSETSIAFSGDYNKVKSFMTNLEKNTRKVYMKDITLNRQKGDELSGVMKLVTVSYREPGDEIVYPYPASQSKGVANPFQVIDNIAAAEQTQNPTKTATGNFVMILNSSNDNANKVILMEYPLSATQIGVNTNGIVPVKMNISEKNGIYTYDYTVGTKTYSGTSKLTLEDDVIRLKVNSIARTGADDKVAVTIDINNTTKKAMEVLVVNDDSQKPRLSLGKTTGTVTLKKQ